MYSRICRNSFSYLILYLAAFLLFGIASDKALYASDICPGERLFKEGIREYEQQNYASAIEVFKKAADYGHVEAQYALGTCYMDRVATKREPLTALKWYLKAAKNGHAEARYCLYEIYRFGDHGIGFGYKGIKPNENEAEKWLRLAAEQGHPKAQTRLGLSYEIQSFGKCDYLEAVKWYHKAIEQEYPEAYYRLGRCFSSGRGTAKNFYEALVLYRKAAELGDRSAADILAIHEYEEQYAKHESRAKIITWQNATNNLLNDYNGVDFDWKAANIEFSSGVSAFSANDYISAAQWYRKSAERGFTPAQHALATLYNKGLGVEKDDDEFSKWSLSGIEQGDAVSTGILARYCIRENDHDSAMGLYRALAYRGDEDCGQIILLARNGDESALTWLKGIAEKGHSEAQNNFGFMYRNGDGVAQNFTVAIDYFKILLQNTKTNKERADITGIIADCYSRQGDMEKAEALYREAAEQGDADSQFHFGSILSTFHNNHNEAALWLERAASQDHAVAQYYLGVCYAEGKGVRRDYSKAIELFESAAAQGVEAAQKKLDSLNGLD